MSVLAADIGGTKTLTALVRGSDVIASHTFRTDPGTGPEAWLALIEDRARQWSGQFDAIGITVTGQVHQGLWNCVNPDTLTLSEFDLAAALQSFGMPFEILNDAQAAAWGEHVYGAGMGSDLVYLTVSTGLGGGIVANGRLVRGRRGLAGHFGMLSQSLLSEESATEPVENVVTGRWIAREGTLATGQLHTTMSVFESARDGAEWAQKIVEKSAMRVARICRDIFFTIDPPQIIIGGGVGLVDGFVPLVRQKVSELMSDSDFEILTSALNENAGVVGIAAFAANSQQKTWRNAK